MNPEDLKHSLDEATEVNRELVRRQSGWRVFWHGIVYGVGATVGAAVVVALVVWVLNLLAGIDLFKPAVEGVLPYVERVKRTSTDSSLPNATYSTQASPSISSSPVLDLSPSPEPTVESGN